MTDLAQNMDRVASRRPGGERAVAVWLLTIAGLVFAMIVLGGVTRLTGSGLSMVEWRPVTGWLPPFSDSAWWAAFEQYQQFPEYQQINRGMTLLEFKNIYWLEYLHRLLGRLLGLAFAVPFVVFLARRAVTKPLAWRLGVIFLLGAGQGALGWFMVQSGLVDRPDVSHYRLTAHLGLAVIILAMSLQTAMSLRWPQRRLDDGLARITKGVAALVFLQILSGGLVAGLDAGHAYNSWPLMVGAIAPDEIFNLAPAWHNFFENVAMVQFQHRLGGYAVALAVIVLWWRARRPQVAAPTRQAVQLVLGLTLLQVALGIATLLLVVPVALAALHQAVAIALFAALLYMAHRSAC
jgi:cytochrome c oxidase assembly protein subunit 15